MLPRQEGLYVGLRRQDRSPRKGALLHGPERGAADHGADAPADAAAHAKADAQANSSTNAQPNETAKRIAVGSSHRATVGSAFSGTEQHAQFQSHRTRQAVHGL